MATSNRPLAVVTGASSGIGFHLARCCAENGFDLVVAADEALPAEAAQWGEKGAAVESLVADLAKRQGVDALLEKIGGRPVEALLANAGHGLGHAFLDQSFDEVRGVIDTNITGTLDLVQRLGTRMRDAGRGRILITGSIAGFIPGTFQAVYNGTKAFIDSFSWALRNELKDSGVTVTCLMPGPTDTHFFARADMLDTKVASDKKDDPADVAKVGFDAMMAGEGDVVAGWKNKLQVAMAGVVPSSVLAEQHRKTAEPGERAMKALTYHGSKDVRVETVADPTLVEADDIILRVTATAICGSDLHIYRGKIPTMKTGDILGHEFMGVVEDVGSAVTNVKRGDRVVVPFTISCGECFFCNRRLFAACETTNPDRGAILNKKDTRSGAALFGYSHLYGGVAGGQAEFVRVPKANVGPLVIPQTQLSDEQVLFLSDILPTGYQAVVNADVGQGSSVAIFGAGPVGLMAAASARMLGAERIFMVDHHPYRLEFAAATYGVEPINFDESKDAANDIIDRMDGRGVDATIDAVGFEAKGSTVETVMTNLRLEGSSGAALRQAMAATRRGGTVSVPGVYAGFIHGFLFGDAFEKGLTFKGGQTHAQRFMPELLSRIEAGDLRPEVIISHRMALEDAAKGYEIFEKKQEDCRKVVLRPATA